MRTERGRTRRGNFCCLAASADGDYWPYDGMHVTIENCEKMGPLSKAASTSFLIKKCLYQDYRWSW